MKIMEAKVMWFLKFIFIVLGVAYELTHYVTAIVYTAVSKKLSAYFYKPDKGRV